MNIAPGTEVIDVANNFVDGHVATGLARPEVFNWPDHMPDVIAADQPDALVITLGSNDDQTLTGEGGVGPYGSPEWMTEYRRRVGGMMDALTANSDRILFWVGVPVLRVRAEDRYNPINQIFREEAAKRPGRVVYIDLDTPVPRSRRRLRRHHRRRAGAHARRHPLHPRPAATRSRRW